MNSLAPLVHENLVAIVNNDLVVQFPNDIDRRVAARYRALNGNRVAKTRWFIAERERRYARRDFRD